MISKTMQTILHALSYGNIEVEASRRLADIKKLDAMRIFVKKLDTKVYNGAYEVPVRLYFPSEEAMSGEPVDGEKYPVLLFFHGGGWVTESVENYDRVCSRMAQSTGHIVMSVEYRLAPEYHFPVPLEDCYAAAVCLLARERGEFMPRKQILIYPALNNCYTEESPYRSVQENGEGYLLTAVKMEDYLRLYESSPDDRQNPYFAPILEKDLSHMPYTLILTAEFDPLRDEGEAYGKRLEEAGNYVEVHRIPEALHGYFALGIRFLHVQESFEIMNKFLEKEADKTWKQDIQNGEN